MRSRLTSLGGASLILIRAAPAPRPEIRLNISHDMLARTVLVYARLTKLSHAPLMLILLVNTFFREYC
uniref:Uncharacterized protein n=1 Tax=Arundo donax TaxID=35708 RepID=A0A0A9EQ61_ARUDO